MLGPLMTVESLFHVTVLSNFARAFDKYSRRYSKTSIPESSFPDRFFLLRRDELDIGISKARGLLERLSLAGDRLIVLETQVPESRLLPNERTGLGRFIPEPGIRLTAVHVLEPDGSLSPWDVETAHACSLRVLHPTLSPYGTLRPRSISFLPVARGCQADCAFCFSEASISSEQTQRALSLPVVESLLEQALARGAERAVITGGGEPGLLPFPRLLELVRACAARFPQKVVLISNGWPRGGELHPSAALPASPPSLVGAAPSASRLPGLSHGLRPLHSSSPPVSHPRLSPH